VEIFWSFGPSYRRRMEEKHAFTKGNRVVSFAITYF
jgi:hypothetical protein